MASKRDPLVSLELRRLQLEEQVSKLRAALRHWQTWDAEYEGLKEDLNSLSNRCTKEEIIKVGKDFGGALVNDKEVASLVGPANLKRNRTQIVSLVSRRIEYVQRNVDTVQKQLDAAQEKLKALLVVQRPDAIDEGGFPLTEIVEELDENGEIISGSTRAPRDVIPETLETLRKAGLTDLPKPEELRIKPGHSNDFSSQITKLESSDEDEDEDEHAAHPTLSKTEGKRPEKVPVVAANRFTPAPGNPNPIAGPSVHATIKPSAKNLPESNHNYEDTNSSDDHASDDDSDENGDQGVAGIKDTPEEARQRQEMLEYQQKALNEVGAIVAELEIDEEGVDDEAIDLPLDETYDLNGTDDSLGNEESEEEDEHGRSNLGMVDENYIQRMLELEKRLMGPGVQNLGPNPQGIPEEDVIATQALEPLTAVLKDPSKPEKPKSGKKKKVAFTEDLDIAPSSANPTKSNEKDRPAEPLPPTMQESIIERQPQSPLTTQSSSKNSKTLSRFSAIRNANALNKADVGASAPPADSRVETHSDTIVERDPLPSRPKSPDLNDFDETLHQQEIVNEFFQKRNKLIGRQGGFRADNDDEEEEQEQESIPLSETGSLRKPSRFKAARLK